MLGHYFKYSFRSILRTKEVLFWTLMFPIALATFMHMAFGNIYDTEEVFKKIPVAVIENVENKTFDSTVQSLSTENGILELKSADNMDKAEKMLKEDKIKGIFVVDKDISLVVNASGMKETILNMVLTQYKQYNKIIQETLEKNPQNVESVIKILMSKASFYTEKSVSEGNLNEFVTYFYAIFAMSCLFAGFSGVDRAANMQADATSLGIRRTLAPNSKLYLILTEFFSALVVQVIFNVIAFLYMKFVLNIDFGTKYAAILLIFIMGSGIGIAMGMIVGCLRNIGQEAKIGIVCAVSMGLSVMADLVANGVKDAIEHHAPIINRINPAALIVDSFYSLNVYDTYERFAKDMALLGIIIFALLFVSFLLVRRVRYASI